MRKLLILLPLLLLSAPTYAACTGSGAVWSCPAGATVSDVNTAYSSATADPVFTFANGSYNWTGAINWTTAKGGTFICATVGGCTVTVNSDPQFSIGFFSGGPFTHLVRISGFVFNDTHGGFTIWFCSGGGCSGTWQQIRIDHNTFNISTGGVAVFLGESTDVGAYFYGVIDHNTVSSSGSVLLYESIGKIDNSPPISSPLGTSNNMFIEDNTITITTMTDSGTGCVDGWASNNMVIRHNTSLNCLWTSHGVTHGGGPQNVELYNNLIQVDSGSTGAGVDNCFRCFHHQGSDEFISFNNVFKQRVGSTHSGTPLDMLHYRDAAGVNHTGSVTSVSVSAGTATFNGTFSTCASGCSGAYWNMSGFAQAGNNTYILITSASTTQLSGSATTQVNDTTGTANFSSVDGGYPQCDGTVVTTPFTDGNRSPTATNRGYPCFRQPGRDTNGNAVPMYSWNNFWQDDSSLVVMAVDDPGGVIDYFTAHMQANRDWYNAVSASAQTNPTTPFDGTTGMGFGTLANRPTTCTTNSTEAGTGVGYAAQTIAGTIGASAGAGTDSNETLYACTATNTWSQFYTHYTYPHPLTVAQIPISSGSAINGRTSISGGVTIE